MKKGKLTDRIKEYVEAHPYDLDAAAGLAAAYSHIKDPTFYDKAKWTEVKLRSALNGNDTEMMRRLRFVSASSTTQIPTSMRSRISSQ